MNEANNFNVEQQQNMFDPYQQNNYSNISIANRGVMGQRGP